MPGTHKTLRDGCANARSRQQSDRLVPARPCAGADPATPRGRPPGAAAVSAAFERAVQAHDEALSGLGLEIWCGTEPTFTDRFSETPEWTTAALGGVKRERAEALVQRLQQRLGGMVLRTVGRQYPREALPRWSYGIYASRDGTRLWRGPPDPLQSPHAPGCESSAAQQAAELQALQAALMRALGRYGLAAAGFLSPDATLRVRFWPREQRPTVGAGDPRLHRPSIHSQAIPAEGLRDELAEAGLGLLILDAAVGAPAARIELPAFACPARLARVLAAIGEAATELALPALILGGYPPPVDPSVRWTTITPDPAVIEVNMAPYPSVSGLLAAKRILYAAAAGIGLSPYRLHYNGAVADSGGGGQITLGGPRPQDSPFRREPVLLPRLVRYFNHHPAMSYLFAHDYLGGSGQAVRTDERGRDAFHELGLALALVAQDPSPTPERVWEGLAQFMTDSCGNSHRAEINIEKLCNPRLPGRGMQGLVEFRGCRMQHTPQRAAALVALLRAVVALLATQGFEAALRDWGDDLHERFALPFYLEQDLEAILRDLAHAGLALDAPLVDEVKACDGFRHWTSVPHAGCILKVRRALEFWPLAGDVGSREPADSRSIDSSTARIELCLRPGDAAPEGFSEWQIAVDGWQLPMREESDAQGPAKVFGLRYCRFVPWLGLHPTVARHGPLRLVLHHPERAQALHLTLHEWRADNAPYPGLPGDRADARARRIARAIAACGPSPEPGSLRPAPREATTPYCLDLRWPIRAG